MKMEFNFDALDREIERLKQAADQNTVDGTVLGALREGGALVQGMAKNLCQVDEGQLSNSIEVTDLRDKVGVDVGTDLEHAIFNEYGTGPLGDPTVAHTTKDKWFAPSTEVDPENGIDERTAEKYHFIPIRTKGGLYYLVHPQAPHPFLYPSVEANKGAIVQLIKDAVQSTIKGG